METLYHITMAYASALLAAILPQVSEVADRLELPTEQPITEAQVQKFIPSPFDERMGGALFLADRSWFHFDERGFVDSFDAPTNWFTLQELDEIPSCYGKSTMTTNQIVEFARNVASQLGYAPSLTQQSPALEGPFDLKNGHHVPYCRVKWETKNEKGTTCLSELSIDIDTQNKRVVGFNFMPTRSDPCFFGKPVKIDIQADSQKYFLQRTLGTRTNTPTQVNKNHVQMTPEYSSELLLLILPRIADFSEKMGLELAKPLSTNLVKTFAPCLIPGKNGGRVELKNGYHFIFDPDGYIRFFAAPGWFTAQFSTPDLQDVTPFLGKATLSTNEIIALGRETLLQLQYPPAMTISEKEPALDWAYSGTNGKEYSDGAIPYCTLRWCPDESSEPTATVGINAREGKVELLELTPLLRNSDDLKKIHEWGTPLQIDAELESLFVHVTPDYSNAVFKIVMPHIYDFSKKLNIALDPVFEKEQVEEFHLSQVRGEVAACVELHNHFWFEFDRAGYVSSYRSPDNYFFAEPDHSLFPSWTPEKKRKQKAFLGETKMSTGEIISLAREVVHRLGYDEEKLQMNRTPELEGPYTLKQGEHIPCCRVAWNPDPDQDLDQQNAVHVEINTQERTVVGFYLHLSAANREDTLRPLKIGVEPEGLPDFLKRSKMNKSTPSTQVRPMEKRD